MMAQGSPVGRAKAAHGCQQRQRGRRVGGAVEVEPLRTLF
jgi:hypothetical protein